ncbi:D-alanyl-D-alanine carboxypeptidase [Anaerosolibacter carboniphilus]|uniref:D-alanyl-D-alanine carboxypeptidase n=1 Tax=Anaerosolibacter carboniphilus TaxID=1417629 RepID=A0A841L4W3_9FIRM|nr:D-alanyl-D-alanine carboxypeptidase family protein [Anaerosolibacter carboniphilus]MBB6217449.1 D-alanyl-D-alanine carboxypeptidase [Anaerosolibacter carboniphilus]
MKGLKRIGCLTLIFSILSASVGYGVEPGEIQSKAAILIEVETGQVLYSKNSDDQLPLASITKLMTYLLAMEAVDSGQVSLEDKVKISPRAANERGSSYSLKAGEEIPLRELIEVMLIISANDAAFAIAEHVGGTAEDFVAKMNERAMELGMTATHFLNPNGMPMAEGTNVSSAQDIMILSRHLIEDYGDRILLVTDKGFYENQERKFFKENTNKLLKQIPEIDGLKTGYTQEAGYCLSSTMVSKAKGEDEEDFRLIVVTFGAATEAERNTDVQKLLTYGHENYGKQRVIKAGERIAEAYQWGMKELPIQLLAKENMVVFGPGEGLIKNTEVRMMPNYSFFIRDGKKLGELHITLYDDRIVAVDLVAEEDMITLPIGMIIGKGWHNMITYISQFFGWGVSEG